MSGGTSTREACTIEVGNGVNLDARLYRASASSAASVAVLVHPYTVLGGCQWLMRGIATGLADRGLTALTFDMRGAGKSSGRASLTGFPEVDDVVSVCKWICSNLSTRRILLIGSSAGAPIAGSAVDRVEEAVGYVGIGYPFGLTASILFGRHHGAILQSPKPKLFVMGSRDGFTSVKQLEKKLKNSAGVTRTHLIEGAGHFQMEGAAFDQQMVALILQFFASLSL
ncbi:hypothetical protein M569_01594 [Genlisea aurea]|uniref:KANL3/Tex30 alpha/beta hydrolase-like domain-containing protein n=1 Tax=Genlisea aurea TaxID=192259 RepID=S8D6T3_9LAMI|nr:hypothetical protein M569_01594 [Genlisea aurea]